jgi:HAE1 family hydrophobic/amphiphilic exporter-1
MRFPHFFINRPIFAGVLAVLIVLVGVVALPGLPIAQYPEIAPPTVVVSASYPGASAETLAETVATPIEEAINGVEGMLYMSSSSAGDGNVAITATFRQGADINQAQVLVQNRVSTAEPRLPEEVRQIGVTVRKTSPDLLFFATLISPDGSLDQQYLSNYATLQLLDRINRVPGVSDVKLYGGRDYNMRIWIDPDRATALNLTVDEVVAAVRAQNAQVAAGSVGKPPFNRSAGAFQLNVQAKGRLTTPSEFGDIVLRRLDEGRVIRLRDVARVELGAEDYSVNTFLNRQSAIGMVISQLPGSNALSTARAVKAELADAAKSFPRGMVYRIPYDPTLYIAASIKAVEHTLIEAVVLVALVVLFFLQSWRAAIIPILAIPISLVGSIAALAAFGFSLNNLSLFGLVLAIGIVVDDAIVVTENIQRLMDRDGLSAREAAHKTMDEVSGALIAIALVLIGVFLPTIFIPGISGQFYKQFALTIISATAISCFVSLTLSPAVAARVLRPKSTEAVPAPGLRGAASRFSRGFNRGFDRLSERYGAYTARAVRALALVGIVYLALIGLTGWRFASTPTGFIPAQDQGYLIGVVQMPPGASLQRTTEVVDVLQQVALKNPATADVAALAGFDAATSSNAPNSGSVYIALKPKTTRLVADRVADQLRTALRGVTAGKVLIISPPPVRGIGTGGGFKMMVEDRSGKGLGALETVTNRLSAQANQTKGLTRVYTPFNTATPRLYADIDRERAEKLGVPVESVFSTLGTYLGSTYINDFNFLGRTYRVTAQADAPYRDVGADVGRLRTRSDASAMVPLDAVMTLRNDSGPYRVVRYNLYPSAELQGDTSPGYASGQSLNSMEKLASQVLPQGFAFEWTELAFQQKQAGHTGAIAFGLAVVFVFLLLAALYESLVLPLAVILIVPMCLLAAMLGVGVMRLDNNILTQIGLVVLIGLAAKNAILIVEFARQNEDAGQARLEAARQAAASRLRPILMTSVAFILGTLPLVIGNGPGSELRQALGVAVFFGMIGVTLFGLLITPAFYVISRNLGDWAGTRLRRAPPAAVEPAE